MTDTLERTQAEEQTEPVHTLHVTDATGDTRLTWSRGRAEEVEAARSMFDSLKSKGYLAYAVQPGGGQGDVLSSFNPEAEAIIMTPQIVGG